MARILVINPGSTSTKLALFEDEKGLHQETLRHKTEEASANLDREEQARFRREALFEYLTENNLSIGDLSALVVRGGLLKPLSSGTYLINDAVYEDLINAKYGWHASNLGAIIALPIAREAGIPLYTVDPVTVDEFENPARYSGLEGLERRSMSHALNMKAVGRLAADRLDKRYEDLNLVIVHLGSGISVSAHRHGNMIDVNNANEEGPFSMERCGTLPALSLVSLCYSGQYNREEAISQLISKGGIYSYLGTKDFASVQGAAECGDEQTIEVVEAMAYQIAKEIGAMSTVLNGQVDRIILTGGMAHARKFVAMINDKVSFIASMEVFPGEVEMEALAAGARRVLRGEEQALIYYRES